jgi:citrate synthase
MADSLTIKDNRTGTEHETPITWGTYPDYGSAIPANDFRGFKTSEEDFGLLTYDPGLGNTASCKSGITFIDGERGILRYRGYPIEQLAEKSSYMEVAYLLIYGELPDSKQLAEWDWDITHHTIIHEKIKSFLNGFHHDAHPMGILVSTVAALSTFYPECRDIHDPAIRTKQVHRLIAKMPTLAAFAYRYSVGLPYSYPDNDLSYAGNFLKMMFEISGPRYSPDPVLEKVLDVLFILHADHEQNCSTNAMRSVGSSDADPYVSVSAATAALYGPLHGGANEQVLRMLDEIGDVKNVPEYVKRARSGEFRLMGFGHRVYKNYDPRATILRNLVEEVFDVTGRNPMLDIAIELERIALEDEYFVTRNLYPNVDFYSGIIYQAMGFPVELFPVLFAIPRTSGWLAHWLEMREDPELKIVRPRQVYTGYDTRDYVSMEDRNS